MALSFCIRRAFPTLFLSNNTLMGWKFQIILELNHFDDAFLESKHSWYNKKLKIIDFWKATVWFRRSNNSPSLIQVATLLYFWYNWKIVLVCMCLLSFQNLTKKKKDQSLTTVHSNKKCILETELDIRYLFFLSRFFMVSWTIFYFIKKAAVPSWLTLGQNPHFIPKLSKSHDSRN